MTDKHIPASRLLALPRWDKYRNLDPRGEFVNFADLRALIDEAPEVEPMAKVLCIIDEDGELEPHTFYSNDEAPRQEELKNKFVIFDVWLSPPPSTDLTKLVGELVEALDRYSGCYGRLSDEINALVTRAKEYLK